MGLVFIVYWALVFLLFKLLDGADSWDGLAFFNSAVYGSSWFLQTMNDLMIFTLFVLTMIYYLGSNAREISDKLLAFNGSKAWRYFLSIFGAIGLYYALTFQFLIIRDLYDNSVISLDINHSLEFTGERIFGFIAFTINSLSVFFGLHFFLTIWRRVTNGEVPISFISLILGTGLYLVLENEFPVLFIITILTLYLAVILITKIDQFYREFNYLSILYVAGGLVLSAIVASYSITSFERFRNFDLLKEFGESQLIDEDVFGEFYMNEAISGIESDVFISNWLSSPFVSREIISRKIKQVYLHPYLNRYDLRIYIFNQTGRPLNPSETRVDYQTINSRISTSEDATEFENIFIKRGFRTNLFKRYYAFAEITRRNTVIGHIVLDFSQRRLTTNNVYPELLVDSRIVQPPKNKEIHYVLFSGNAILSNFGDFNYGSDFESQLLNDPKLFARGIRSEGHFHVGIKVNESRVLVLSTHEHSLFEMVSTFSFLFTILFVATIVFLAIYFRSLRLRGPLLGLAPRIQFYLNLAFILPLILISVTTLSILNNQSIREIEESYRQKAEDISENIQRDLDNYLLDPAVRKDILTEKLTDAANLLETDADLYHLSGNLIASTQPKVFELGLKSKFVDPVANQQILTNRANFFMNEENVGNLLYNVTYIPVRTANTGKIIGILGLPFFEFRSILEAQQITVITNILNVFSILLIILLVISYFASQKLVDPLKMIAKRLTVTSFTGYNTPIEWDSEDEIGMLVEEYNKMIVNLEESKQILTRTQKELAWREIAKQVAHEIKNPLTPMKLSLQQLQRRINELKNERPSNEVQGLEIDQKVQTLLQQVDTLNEIATSFSAFAKMPIPEMKKFEIVELVRKTANLHGSESNSTIRFQTEESTIHVMGDEKLMGRIITNLILNARQSSTSKQVSIDISTRVIGQNAQIMIEDDGDGIPESVRDKVFLPSFSTKEDGSGIGLAIAKHGIEQSGGSIWFETESGIGTKFGIELPLAENES